MGRQGSHHDAGGHDVGPQWRSVIEVAALARVLLSSRSRSLPTTFRVLAWDEQRRSAIGAATHSDRSRVKTSRQGAWRTG
jgi:hypothetical protein